MCNSARERCPAFPDGGERIHWSVEDSAEAEARDEPSRRAFRTARDDLRTRIKGFLRQEATEGRCGERLEAAAAPAAAAGA